MARLTGTSENDTLTGSVADDTFYGDDGDDYLVGGGGWDHFYGGEGADTIVGSVYVEGGNGEDYSYYRDSSVGVNVNLETGRGYGGTAEGDVLINISGLVGSKYGDVLVGTSSGNWLAGEDGDDLLIGGGASLRGYDVYVGGNGSDTMVGGANKDSYTYYETASNSNSANIDLIKNFVQGEDEIFLLYTNYLDISEFTITKSGGFTTVQSNKEDFIFRLEGEYDLTSSDFRLADKPIGQSDVLVAASSFTDANAIMYGTSWSGVAETAANVTYTFDYTIPTAYYEGTGQVFDATQQAAAKAALQYVSDVANINFTETNSVDADIIFVASDTNNTGVAWSGEYASGQFDDVTVEIRDTLVADKGQEFADYIYIHEVGHSLGLQHPQDGYYNLDDDVDLVTYSVMSYGIYDDSEVRYNGLGRDSNLPDAPMFLDIVALQHLYGANTGYNAGNTTYSFSGIKSAQTIWDGAGIDAIDASSYGGAAVIDLREGLEYRTTIGDGNIWIAQNANIENVSGAVGNDVIYGNALGNALYGNEGDDTITGGAGDDIIAGGLGNDTAILSGNFADYTLTQISSSGADGLDSFAGIEYLQFSNGTYSWDADSLAWTSSSSSIGGGGGGGSSIIDVAEIIDNAEIITPDIADNTDNAATVFVRSPVDFKAIVRNLREDGGAGDDRYDGGADNNNIHGGAGSDILLGNGGDDFLQGNRGEDKLYGGDGSDEILGGKDNDYVQGNRGQDYVNGNNGNDYVLGGKDSDEVHGGKDDDYVNGNNGNDYVYGDRGNDTVHGGKGDDYVYGRQGNDLVYGDKGSDTLEGGSGADIFGFNVTDIMGGNDIIVDFEAGIDKIQIAGNIANLLSTNLTTTDNGVYLRFTDTTGVTINNITNLEISDFI